jgi:hypothetical protein
VFGVVPILVIVSNIVESYLLPVIFFASVVFGRRRERKHMIHLKYSNGRGMTRMETEDSNDNPDTGELTREVFHDAMSMTADELAANGVPSLSWETMGRVGWLREWLR